LALGKKLAAQLDDEGDLVSAWLSHLLAERVTEPENAPAKSKAAAQQACVDLILELWRHNAYFPDRARPYADMDPIMRAMESLDPERNEFRYSHHARRAANSELLPEAAERWLKFASGVDNTARYLVRLALGQAVEASGSAANEWADLARTAAADEGPTGVVIRFVTESGEANEKSVDEQIRRERLDTLNTFIRLAQSLATELESLSETRN
jgi:hypothetical protein